MSNPLPDDVCQVCSETRENHGDKLHHFSTDGQLVSKTPPPAPKNTPPTPAGSALARDPLVGPLLRLVEQLVSKGILEPQDLVRIFGGGDGNPNPANPKPAQDPNSR